MEPFQFPRPPTSQDFESLVETLVRNRNPTANVQRFGRNGQAQHGVDVALIRQNGTADGYQCKHVAALTTAEVLAEAGKASGFPGGMSRFIIYTTSARDTQLQDAARQATKRHPFLTVVSAWEDVAVEMMLDLQASRQYLAALPVLDLPGAYLDQLSVAFDRPAFTTPAREELSLQDQLQAIVDTGTFLSTGLLDSRDARFVLRSLPAFKVPKISREMKGLRKALTDLKRQVTIANQAEKRGDAAQVDQLGPSIDAARTTVMKELNGLLANWYIDPVQYEPGV